MDIEQNTFNQVATTLAGHFDSLYYVDIETGRYIEFIPTKLFQELNIPKTGEDFWDMTNKYAPKCVHPNDIERVLHIHSREVLPDIFKKSASYSVVYRLVLNGRIIHARHIDILCEDKKHFLFCMENIEEEVQEKRAQEKMLQSAERMARIDKLTGIKNRNAFTEYAQEIDRRIQSVDRELCFGIIMCDVNDLKRFNDTRGHSFGDEMLRRSCRMICEIFKNSQVYRNGGDEFVVVLTGEDYEIREELLENLRSESLANLRSRSGPVIASGMAEYDPDSDVKFSDVFSRADSQMYENKRFLKSGRSEGFSGNAREVEIPYPDERRRKLDALYGALFTMAGDGYIYLNDLKYDYSRLSVAMVDDFNLPSEYMYHTGVLWEKHVHPEDLSRYKDVIDAILFGKGEVRFLRYRIQKPDGTYMEVQPRSFILNDDKGNPEYYGGIIIPI
ncbi:MAG: diguanylate cyclase [Lachnospiraceae bacterium]|nr:diguanylate cyclase [Lachnospiraceae bacterium]